MSDQVTVHLLAQMFVEEAGRNNALSAALVGLLSALGANPELATAVRTTVEQQYSNYLATAQNPVYMEGFERARDLVYTALDDG